MVDLSSSFEPLTLPRPRGAHRYDVFSPKLGRRLTLSKRPPFSQIQMSALARRTKYETLPFKLMCPPTRLATGAALARCEAKPGTELPSVSENLCIGHGGGQRPGGHRTDAEQFAGASGNVIA